jgi:hypothetical protein
MGRRRGGCRRFGRRSRERVAWRVRCPRRRDGACAPTDGSPPENCSTKPRTDMVGQPDHGSSMREVPCPRSSSSTPRGGGDRRPRCHGFHAGRPPRNKGFRYPPDPPRVEEIIAVMCRAGEQDHGCQAARGRHRQLTSTVTTPVPRRPLDPNRLDPPTRALDYGTSTEAARSARPPRRWCRPRTPTTTVLLVRAAPAGLSQCAMTRGPAAECSAITSASKRHRVPGRPVDAAAGLGIAARCYGVSACCRSRQSPRPASR